MIQGDKIQKLRKEKGFTQAELAKEAGLSEISIRKYENGDRKPKIETLRCIANALEVPLYELADWGQYTTEDFVEDLKIPLNPENGHVNKERTTATLRNEAKNKLDMLNHQGLSKACDYIGYLADKPENIEPNKE
ncbi:putative transcriptional regulator with C-terminal CBS domains [Clostridium sp. ASBs410]|nr:putative transcriptional regulator with C-terminal CBS domains [Clostridium sp. ASBs410]